MSERGPRLRLCRALPTVLNALFFGAKTVIPSILSTLSAIPAAAKPPVSEVRFRRLSIADVPRGWSMNELRTWISPPSKAMSLYLPQSISFLHSQLALPFSNTIDKRGEKLRKEEEGEEGDGYGYGDGEEGVEEGEEGDEDGVKVKVKVKIEME